MKLPFLFMSALFLFLTVQSAFSQVDDSQLFYSYYVPQNNYNIVTNLTSSGVNIQVVWTDRGWINPIIPMSVLWFKDDVYLGRQDELTKYCVGSSDRTDVLILSEKFVPVSDFNKFQVMVIAAAPEDCNNYPQNYPGYSWLNTCLNALDLRSGSTTASDVMNRFSGCSGITITATDSVVLPSSGINTNVFSDGSSNMSMFLIIGLIGGAIWLSRRK